MIPGEGDGAADTTSTKSTEEGQPEDERADFDTVGENDRSDSTHNESSNNSVQDDQIQN